ncbi:glycoside hydrolase family 28 protein [Terrimonas pollutisoli]|uniref:glycoside hydrolase family 28 protein n=1 Tax=Terrimonas pollutisoli TaxID=3034147 RepID=UPI0023EBE69B|nr:glycosyl hydrolase family 28 protein [Terrimonas sp. H1YJ31]
MDDKSSLSRRQWLGRVSVPALTVAGASMIGMNAMAAPGGVPDDDKLSGTRIYNIQDYGAKGDGKTLNTAAIQSAIDTCYKDKGGTVLIPAGDFIAGTLELKSNVTLHLAAAGKLLGSPKREDYTTGKGVPPGNGNIVFLFAVNAHNISIEGKGTIDGNGLAFYNGKGDNTGPGQNGVGGNFDRPHLGIFYQCNNLRMHDTFCTASAYHCFRILSCKQVYIDGVRIYNRVNRNNDGFHFNNSENVHIMNCDVQCQDDACALFGSNKFVTITNCSFSTRWSIFRFGGGESQNIVVSNCLIYGTYGCPIKISAGRASIENFSFSNIIMRNVTGPIGIGFSGPDNNSPNNNQSTKKPFIRNISFNNIRASVVAKPIDHPDIHFGVSVREGEKNSCITLNAMGEYYLENISFTDVHVSYAGGGTAAQAAKVVPNVAAEYFGVWDPAPGGPPAYGLYARNVKGLTLQNIRFEYDQPDARPAIIFDNVQDATINGLSAKGSTTNELLRFINSKDVLLTGTKVLTPAAIFLRVEGASSEGIIVDGGDTRKATQALAIENGAAKESVEFRV